MPLVPWPYVVNGNPCNRSSLKVGSGMAAGTSDNLTTLTQCTNRRPDTPINNMPRIGQPYFNRIGTVI